MPLTYDGGTFDAPAVAYPDAVLADSPYLWYRLGEPSGTVAEDSSGNNRDGTYIGTPALAQAGLIEGDSDDAAKFNEDTSSGIGTDSCETPTLTGYGSWTEISIEAWIKPTPIVGGASDPYFPGHQHVLQGPHPIFTGANGLDIRAPGAGRTFQWRYSDTVSGGHDLVGTTAADPDEIYHVVVTMKNGGSAKLYVNCDLEDEIVLDGNWTTGGDGKWKLANTDDTAAEPRARVTLDEFALYDHELTAEEVCNHHEAGATLGEPPPESGDPGDAWTPPTLAFIGGEEVTDELTDLWWAIENPGGFVEGGFKVAWSIEDPQPYDDYSEVVVTSALDSRVLWEGRIEACERQSDANGMWAVFSVYGWKRHVVDDDFYRGLLRDKRMDHWYYAGPESPPHEYLNGVSWDVGPDPSGELAPEVPCIRVVFPPLNADQVLPLGHAWDQRILVPETFPRSGARRLRFQWKCLGGAPASARIRVYSAPYPDDGDPRTLLYDNIWQNADGVGYTGTGVVDVQGKVRSGVPDRIFIIRVFANPYGQITSFGTSGRTIRIHDLALYGTPLAPSGGALLAGHSAIREIALACAPALHVVGQISPVTSLAVTTDSVQTMPTVIEHLIQETAAAPAELFDLITDLYVTNPLTDEWTWGVFEKIAASGLYRLAVGPSSTSIDYYVRGVETQDLRTEVDLRNKAVLTWSDFADRSYETTRTQSISELTALGITRTVFADLGRINRSAARPVYRTRFSGRGGQLQFAGTQDPVQRYGDALLRRHKRRIRYGTIRVIGSQVKAGGPSGTALPVRELTAEGGKLIWIADTSSDLTTPSTPATDPRVFRVRRVEVHESKDEATITVDQGSMNLEALLARLSIVP